MTDRIDRICRGNRGIKINRKSRIDWEDSINRIEDRIDRIETERGETAKYGCRDPIPRKLPGGVSRGRPRSVFSLKRNSQCRLSVSHVPLASVGARQIPLASVCS